MKAAVEASFLTVNPRERETYRVMSGSVAGSLSPNEAENRRKTSSLLRLTGAFLFNFLFILPLILFLKHK